MSSTASHRRALRLIYESTDHTARLAVTKLLLLVALGAALAAGSPLALKHLVDAVGGLISDGKSPQRQDVLACGAIYLLILIGCRLASDVRPMLANSVEQRVSAAIRQRFLAHLHRLPMSYLVHRRSGELLHSTDLATISAQSIISHLTNSITPVLIELVLMVGILASLDQPRLVALFIVTSVLYLAIFTVGVRRQRPIVRALSAASLDVHALLSDGIAYGETLRCFGAIDQAQASLTAASSQLMAGWRAFHRLATQGALAATTTFALALTTCFAISLDAVTHGTMTVGGFVLASVYMLQMVRPLEILGGAAKDLSRAVGFMQPLLDVLAEPTEEAADWPLPDTGRGQRHMSSPSIRFENLQFGYDPQRPVIRGLNLDIPAGCTTAIVGRSGSGKSSLVRLLLRLYTPQAGRIFMNGISIDQLAITELRADIALVPQDAGLLHGTVRSNIALGMPEASHQDIMQAAKNAQVHQSIVALPDGYDTMLGERGQTLSGGERQRISIARALLIDPRILILDEATASVDSETEKEIQKALDNLVQGRTTIAIAHRLSTLQRADRLIVLDRGQVVEEGTHDELMVRQGAYYNLYQAQARNVDTDMDDTDAGPNPDRKDDAK